MNRKRASLHLYYKQGDDLSYHITNAGRDASALLFHSGQLKDATCKLDRLHEVFEEYGSDKICIETADTHMIVIEGDEDIINKLISEDVLNDDMEDWFEDEEELEEDTED